MSPSEDTMHHLAPPWEADYEAGYGEDGEHGIRIYAAARECQTTQLVAEVYGVFHARLVVASPDLLAAAEFAAQCIEDMAEGWEGNLTEYMARANNAADECRAAIQKARGA